MSSENINGIFTVDSCECTSPKETCEPNGPFIVHQQKSSIVIRYGSSQVGTGILGKNRMDLNFNQNRCKGVWNGQTHLLELKCQRQGGIVCSTNLRCLSGLCLTDTSSLTLSSSSTSFKIASFLLLISSSFIILV